MRNTTKRTRSSRTAVAIESIEAVFHNETDLFAMLGELQKIKETIEHLINHTNKLIKGFK